MSPGRIPGTARHIIGSQNIVSSILCHSLQVNMANKDTPRPAVLNERNTISLLGMPFCPSTERIRLALGWKGLEYAKIDIDLSSKPPWLFDLNPFGQVPVLVLNEFAVYDSMICLEYLDEAFPSTKRLFPSDADHRAWMRLFANFVDKRIVPAFWGLLKSKGQSMSDRIAMDEGLDILSRKIKVPFVIGTDLTAADIVLFPWVKRLYTLTAMLRFELKQAQILQWYDGVVAHEVFANEASSNNLMRRFYDSYSLGKPDYTLGALAIPERELRDEPETKQALLRQNK